MITKLGTRTTYRVTDDGGKVIYDGPERDLAYTLRRRYARVGRELWVQTTTETATPRVDYGAIADGVNPNHLFPKR